MKKLLFLVMVLYPLLCFSQSAIRQEDKVRISEAMKINSFIGDSIWSDWSKTDFVVLFVTDSLEYLINHPNPSAEFSESYFDDYLNTKVYTRKKVFQKNFLATFPAVNGITCIVVGTPENTNKSSMGWVITLMHEHLHQYQFNHTGYYAELDKLDLKNGDETGMWALNYKFPYEDAGVNTSFNNLKSKLINTLLKTANDSLKYAVDDYIETKNAFEKSVSEKDIRYFEFQLWQEGMARYTEYKVMSYLLKNNFKFSEEFKTLTDFIPINEYYGKRLKGLMEETQNMKLAENQRGCFYSMGALEGIILDVYKPGWKKNYFTSWFNTTKFFSE